MVYGFSMATLADLKTPLQWLVEIDTAQTAILTSGQSYRLGDRTFTRADLAELEKFRQQKLAEYTRQTGLNHPAVSTPDFRSNF